MHAGYSSQEWLELRDNIVRRDGHRCRNCGSHEVLEVHHWLPVAEFQDRVDHLGYSSTDHPLIVEQSGLVTLCKECHDAMTSRRTQNAVLKNPRLQQLGRNAQKELFNIFQLWALNSEKLPSKSRRPVGAARSINIILSRELKSADGRMGLPGEVITEPGISRR